MDFQAFEYVPKVDDLLKNLNNIDDSILNALTVNDVGWTPEKPQKPGNPITTNQIEPLPFLDPLYLN